MKNDMTIHDNMTMDDNGKSPICIHLHRSLTHQTLDYLFCLPKGFHSIIYSPLRQKESETRNFQLDIIGILIVERVGFKSHIDYGIWVWVKTYQNAV